MKKRKYGLSPKDIIYALTVPSDPFMLDIAICSRDYFLKNNSIESPSAEYEKVRNLLEENYFTFLPRENVGFYSFKEGKNPCNSVKEIVNKMSSFGFTRDDKFEDYIVDLFYGTD